MVLFVHTKVYTILANSVKLSCVAHPQSFWLGVIITPCTPLATPLVYMKISLLPLQNPILFYWPSASHIICKHKTHFKSVTG